MCAAVLAGSLVRFVCTPPTEIGRKRFFERRCAIRRTVPTPNPVCLAIARQEAPDARRPSICDSWTPALGRPSFFPFARALRRPALTRSWIKARSNSAIAPMIWNINRPDGVLSSGLSRKLRKATSEPKRNPGNWRLNAEKKLKRIIACKSLQGKAGAKGGTRTPTVLPARS